MSTSKVNKNEKPNDKLPATKGNHGQAVTIVTSQDDELIEALEKSISEESLKADEAIMKHESKKKELHEIKGLLNYWQEAGKAVNLLNREDVKPEVTVTIATGDGDMCSLRSTKVETVKAVIELLSSSSKERMKQYFHQETK